MIPSQTSCEAEFVYKHPDTWEAQHYRDQGLLLHSLTILSIFEEFNLIGSIVFSGAKSVSSKFSIYCLILALKNCPDEV